MVVGPLEGAFLKMMVQLVGAKRVLEIGMFTGYSALSMAEVLPDHGRLITCEIDPEPAALARKYFSRSSHGGKIEIKMGSAVETIQSLNGPFDLIFIDADKVNYITYYERALDLLPHTGVILIDNVLWSGDVLNRPALDERTAVLQELNERIVTDRRVSAVLVTIRDGVFVVRRANPGR